MSSRIAVGISGEVAAGKTTAAFQLKQLGFGYTRVSMVIDKVLLERGAQPSRERHQEVGWELHEGRGQAWLCEQAIELLPSDTPRLVLDGMRWADDVKYMRDRFGEKFIHVHVSAPIGLRKARFEHDDPTISFEEVITHPVEQGAAELAAMADIWLVNDGDKGTFQKRVEELILERLSNAH